MILIKIKCGDKYLYTFTYVQFKHKYTKFVPINMKKFVLSVLFIAVINSLSNIFLSWLIIKF